MSSKLNEAVQDILLLLIQNELRHYKEIQNNSLLRSASAKHCELIPYAQLTTWLNH